MIVEDGNRRNGVSLPVTQADREAAAAFLRNLPAKNWVEQLRYINDLLHGCHDEHDLPRRFAEHRMQTESRARVEGVRLGLDAAARIARSMVADTARFGYARSGDIATAILSLSEEVLLDQEDELYGCRPAGLAGGASDMGRERYA